MTIGENIKRIRCAEMRANHSEIHNLTLELLN